MGNEEGPPSPDGPFNHLRAPTAQTYQVFNDQVTGQQRFATSGVYYGYVDIAQGRVGFDAKYLYVSLDTWSLDERTDTPGQNITKGLVERYGFRVGKNAANPASARGMLLVVDQPALKTSPTTYNGNKAFGYRDTNGDVGGVGISVIQQDVLSQVNGNGYDLATISDGRSNGGSGTDVLSSRVNPSDASIVEFAFDYAAYAYTAADLTSPNFYLGIEAIKGGPKDPGNYLWNDEYTKSEAGSPYRATTGDLTKSEFGTQGLGNIYELDTLRVGAIVAAPEPASLSLLALGGIAILRRRRA